MFALAFSLALCMVADEYWPPGAVWHAQHLSLLMRNAPE
jgi:hypothetical protein